MSILYCAPCDASYDTDEHEDCPRCGDDRATRAGIKPTEADIGRGVIYRCAPEFKAEPGIITSIGRETDQPHLRTIFVRYATQHPTAPGQATYAGDLEWEFPHAL